MALTKVNTDLLEDGGKLDGIEAGADVTDTTNVTAAGALMDSELTAIASVKALNQGVATTDSPTFAGLTSTGEITANGGIALGDGDVATFGDSDDLSIQHLGGTTYLTNTTGSLVLRSDSFRVLNTANSEQILHGDANGAVTAYYDNSVKLATTSTGIDVTGTATMDGLTVDGTATVVGTTTSGILLKSASGASSGFKLYNDSGTDTAYLNNHFSGPMVFATNNTERLRISSTGAATFSSSVLGSIINAGVSSSVGIGTATADANVAELGSGYLNLGRDDTADAAQIAFSKNGLLHSSIVTDNNDLRIKGNISNLGIRFDGSDNGSNITALHLDMSDAGYATFNSGLNSGGVIELPQKASFPATGFVHYTNSYLYSFGGVQGSIFKDRTGVNEFLKLQPSQIVFNEDGSDMDFRVESNNNANMLFVDGGANRVGIGTGNPSYEFVVSKDGSSGIEFGPEGINSTTSFIQFYNRSTAAYDTARFYGSAYEWYLNGAQTGMTLSTTSLVVNESGVDSDFRVESNNNSHMLFVDAGADIVAFGKTQSITGGGMYFNHSNDTRSHLVVSNTETSYAESLFYGNRQNSDGQVFQFRRQNSNVGSISVSSSATTYNTTSDRRLKKDIETITDGTDKLMAMNPVTHGWKADPEADTVHGFIAQEMMDIVPEAISGDPESDEMMSMDYGRITPVLVAALQDAHKKIMELENRINELEGK